MEIEISKWDMKEVRDDLYNFDCEEYVGRQEIEVYHKENGIETDIAITFTFDISKDYYYELGEFQPTISAELIDVNAIDAETGEEIIIITPFHTLAMQVGKWYK